MAFEDIDEEDLEELFTRVALLESRIPKTALRDNVDGHVHRRHIQEGSGVPTHLAARGVHYWDYTNTTLYVNASGSSTWTKIAPGKAQMLLQWAENNPQGTEGPQTPSTSVGTMESIYWRHTDNGLVAPTAGTIIAIFVSNDVGATTTAGTYKVEAYKNGAATGLTAQTDTTNTRSDYTAGSIAFVQNDIVSVEFTTASWTASAGIGQAIGIIIEFD